MTGEELSQKEWISALLEVENQTLQGEKMVTNAE